MIIHAGDFTEESVLDGLKTIAEVKGVRGNMDSGVLRNLLPEVTSFRVGYRKICVTHDWGGPEGIAERVLKKREKADVLVFGHSHEPYNNYHGGTLLFNPGKATNSYGILDLDQELSAQIIPL